VNVTNEDVTRFIESIPADRRPQFDELQALILHLYPEADVVLWYHVPTYRTKSGWVALGYWKGGASLYTNGPHNLVAFKAAHPSAKTGKASINFIAGEPIPTGAVEQVIRHAMEGMK